MTDSDLVTLQGLCNTAKYHRDLLIAQCNHSHDTWNTHAWATYSKDLKLATDNYKLLYKLINQNKVQQLSF